MINGNTLILGIALIGIAYVFDNPQAAAVWFFEFQSALFELQMGAME